MKSRTIKLPCSSTRRMTREMKGYNVGDCSRELLADEDWNVYALTKDLCGTLVGGSQPATNSRKKFRRL